MKKKPSIYLESKKKYSHNKTNDDTDYFGLYVQVMLNKKKKKKLAQ